MKRNLIASIIIIAAFIFAVFLVIVNINSSVDFFPKRYDTFNEAVSDIRDQIGDEDYPIIEDNGISFVYALGDGIWYRDLLVKRNNGKYKLVDASKYERGYKIVGFDKVLGSLTVYKINGKVCFMYQGHKNDNSDVIVTDSVNSDFVVFDVINDYDPFDTGFNFEYTIWFKVFDEVPEGYELKINDKVVYTY